jgi:hypothetical protein
MKRVSLFFGPFMLMAVMFIAGCTCPARAEEAKAAPVPEQYFLVPSSQIVSPVNSLPQPVTAARAELVPIESEQPAAPSPAAKGGIFDILNNPAILAVFMSLVVGVIKYFDDKKNLEAEKWKGLVYNLYNVGEQSGLVQKIPGAQKLRLVMAEIDAAFQRTYGYRPDSKDRQDMENDLAALAYDDETTLNQRRLEDARAFTSRPLVAA